MSDTEPAAKLPALIPMLCALMGALATMGGILVAVGGWRGSVDSHLATTDRRLDLVEAQQREIGPDMVGVKKDISYLADRARRDDARGDREQRR